MTTQILAVLIAAACSMPTLLWACDWQEAWASNNLLPCMDCSTAVPKNETAGCAYDEESNGIRIFCDCGRANDCYEGSDGTLVNVRIQHKLGICTSGVCMYASTLGTVITARRLPLVVPCGG